MIDQPDYEARAPITVDLAATESHAGRELFSLFRQMAGPADHGAGVLG